MKQPIIITIVVVFTIFSALVFMPKKERIQTLDKSIKTINVTDQKETVSPQVSKKVMDLD